MKVITESSLPSHSTHVNETLHVFKGKVRDIWTNMLTSIYELAAYFFKVMLYFQIWWIKQKSFKPKKH